MSRLFLHAFVSQYLWKPGHEVILYSTCQDGFYMLLFLNTCGNHDMTSYYTAQYLSRWFVHAFVSQYLWKPGHEVILYSTCQDGFYMLLFLNTCGNHDMTSCYIV